jgi:hypothetical protein
VQFNFHDKDMGGYWDMRASCVWSECNEGEMQLRLIIYFYDIFPKFPINDIEPFENG